MIHCFTAICKKEITEYKDGHKKSTDVIKTEVNRLTGTFEHTEHSSIGHSSGDTIDPAIKKIY